MASVRLGIVGLGNIGNHHAQYLLEGKVRQATLTAVADASVDRCSRYQGVQAFSDAHALFASGLVDAVIVATPHYQHTTLGIAALESGLHLLVEKPISAHKADAERLIASAAARPRQVFAAMFQMRVEGRYLAIRKLLQEQLGRVVRIHWTLTDWFRTEAYYASGGWRATWKGEGGGVLLNQCLHQLDMLQWLVGMPSRLRGFCQLGRFHDIEVEDSVSAYLEYENGATAQLAASTGEAPGTNRLEIAGSLGKIVLEDNRLRFFRNETDMLEFSRTSSSGFAKPGVSAEEIPFQDATAPHSLLTQNFVDAILHGEPLLAPGREGIYSVELANAILFSGLLEQTIHLPMDSAAYEAKLNELIGSSTREKKVREVKSEDFASSFRK